MDHKPHGHDPGQLIFGKNSILEALRSGRGFEKIYYQSVHPPRFMSEIFPLAKKAKIPVVQATPDKFKKAGLDQVAHQGIFAILSPVRILSLDDFLETNPRSVAILDEIEDPQNLGAIIRSAEVFGIEGIIIPSRHSAPLSGTAVKASAGAVFHVPVIRVTNLVQTIESLKTGGFWVYGLEADGTILSPATRFNSPVALVIGSEGKGMRPLVRTHCDDVIAIPQSGRVNSLNASVAAGILFYEVFRRQSQDLRSGSL
ncbi:MAG: 23S rRNA (guanosine(2251)-2'-O)-methyltransferase RlmB [Bacteroidetes bacterium]|nr:23S rRNA (guanosine(2251)-2'-O)-methyltransferase RlmB [Bacteroidota bacterium]